MQNWTSEGCVTVVGENGIVSCSCNHLTNFAVLVVSALSMPKGGRESYSILLTRLVYITAANVLILG